MAHPSLLYDEMSGMENVRYFARLYAFRTTRAARRALRRWASIRSSGVQWAVFAGDATEDVAGSRPAARSEDLLLDEPFSNVDIRSAREMVKLLAHMRDQGKTVLW